ncbi:MAG: hypothetical protein H6618_05090 [Deltaproteobacteria bacterium]|nr:hypothetical protein [Deltaproteobacteria bacterium]
MVDTLLAKFVKDFGDMVMEQEVSYLYQSIFAKIIIWAAFVFACLKTFSSFRHGVFSRHFPRFFAAWLACVPVHGIPFGFTVINHISTAFSHSLSKMTHGILSTTRPDMSFPPGFVYNALSRAASMDIEDPALGGQIRVLVENCVPDIPLLTHQISSDGHVIRKVASPADLFSGRSHMTDAGQYEYEIVAELSDALNQRTFTMGNDQHICLSYLKRTREQLVAYIREKNPLKMPENLVLVGSNHGETQHVGIQEIRAWTAEQSSFYMELYSVAANLAQAAMIQKEMLRQYYAVDLTGESRNHALSFGLASTADVELNTIAASVRRFMGLESAMLRAWLLSGIEQNMSDIPLMIAGVQLLVKMAFPMICLLLFFSSVPFKIFSWVWLMSLLTPVYLYFMRSVSDSFHLYMSGLSGLATQADIIKESDPAYLLSGISFAAANRMSDIALQLQQTLLTIEAWLWGGIFMIFPAGLWFSGHSFRQIQRTVLSSGGQISSRRSLVLTDQRQNRTESCHVSERVSEHVSEQSHRSSSVSATYTAVRSVPTGSAIAAVSFVTEKTLDKENPLQDSIAAPALSGKDQL